LVPVNDQARARVAAANIEDATKTIARWWRAECKDDSDNFGTRSQSEPPITRPSLVTPFQSCVEAAVTRYAGALVNDLKYLKRTKDDKNNVLLGALTELEDDLRIKAVHCAQTKGGIGDTVLLKIHTKRNNSEVRGWQILYVPKINSDPNAFPDTFPRISSPTTAKLVPGRYFVWAKKGNTLSPKTMLKVGDSGSDVEWDLPVP
jgi:hypothetical protein